LVVAMEVQIKIVAIAKATIDKTVVKVESWRPRDCNKIFFLKIGYA